MDVSAMVLRVKDRTKQTDESRILSELSGAQAWAFNRIFNSENGADLLVTIDEEVTLVADARTIDLATELTYEVVGLKRLWLKLPNETQFTRMLSVDAGHPMFMDRDTLPDNETTITGHPVYYYVENFSSVRFAGILPSGSVVRVDYFRFPPALDPTTNNTLTSGLDLPAVTHEAIVDYATAEVWDMLDDSRSGPRMMRALDRLNVALYVLQSRSKGPTRTTPYKQSKRSWI